MLNTRQFYIRDSGILKFCYPQKSQNPSIDTQDLDRNYTSLIPLPFSDFWTTLFLKTEYHTELFSHLSIYLSVQQIIIRHTFFPEIMLHVERERANI